MEQVRRVFRRRDAFVGKDNRDQGARRSRGVLRWWPLGVLILVIAGVAVGVLLTQRGASPSANLSQVYTVRRGNLVSTIACTGEVYASRQAELSFDVNKIPLIELAVVPGQKVKAGDLLARIDPTSLERAVAQAEADLITAQDNLEKVKAPYTELDVTQARLTVDQAAVALAEAEKALETVQNPDIEAAERAVQSAEAALQSAQSAMVAAESDTGNAAKIRTLEYEVNWYRQNYGEAQVKFEKGQIDQQKLDWEYSNMLAAEEKLRVARAQAESALASAKNQLAEAQAKYEEAQEELAKLKKGPDPTELAKAKNAVTQAQYNLDKAKADLATIEAGPKPKDIEVAAAKVAGAQAALEAAQATLEAATMVAPFDGTIVSVGAKVGDLVSSGTVVITLADLSDLRVRAIVDETDISNVEIGQEVIITFDAFAGQRFSGKVLEVPLQGTLSQNVVTYQVPVSLEGAEEVALKSGMTANVSIIAGRLQNVLLIPAMAVLQGETGNVVLVQDSPQGPAVETPVLLGLGDGTYVEVKRGLNEGDQIVVEYQVEDEMQGVFRNAMPMPPGGAGGTMGVRVGP